MIGYLSGGLVVDRIALAHAADARAQAAVPLRSLTSRVALDIAAGDCPAGTTVYRAPGQPDSCIPINWTPASDVVKALPLPVQVRARERVQGAVAKAVNAVAASPLLYVGGAVLFLGGLAYWKLHR